MTNSWNEHGRTFLPNIDSYQSICLSLRYMTLTLTMDGRIPMYTHLFLVCLFVFGSGGVLMVAAAQSTTSKPAEPVVSATAMILTPEADRNEGGLVDMRCVAMNFESDHIVEWRSKHPNATLRWNDTTLTTNRRFMFTTTYLQTGMVVQNFTITDLQIDDYDGYVCNVKYPMMGGGHIIVATSSVMLSPPSYPICSPSGPIMVNTDTPLRMRCLSETGNTAVITGTHPMADPSCYLWNSSSSGGTDTLSLNLTVTVADDGVAFNCSVLQGAGADNLNSSCIIGPINVAMPTDGPTPTVTAVTTRSTDTPPPASNSALVAGAVGGGVAALLIIVFLILICRKRRHGHQTQKDQRPKPRINTEFTPDLPKYSPSSFFDRCGVVIHDQSQASHLQYSVTETTVPKPASSPTKPPSSEPVVYAQPNRHQSTISTHSSAGGRYSGNADDVTSHNNPAFDSKDLDGSTEPNAPVKPIAKVRPSKTPRKPQPYQPKSERQSNPPDTTNQDQIPLSPPNDMSSSPPTDRDKSHPAPSNPTYAQVSRPKSNPDHIVYADLDMLSVEDQDGGRGPPSLSDAVTYASVKID